MAAFSRPSPLPSLGRPWLPGLVFLISLALALVAAQNLKAAIERHRAGDRAAHATHHEAQWSLLLERLENQTASTFLVPTPPHSDSERFLKAAESLRKMAPGTLKEAVLYALPAPGANHGPVAAPLTALQIVSVAPGLPRGGPEQLGQALPAAFSGLLENHAGGLLIQAQGHPNGEAPRLVLLAPRRNGEGQLTHLAVFTFDAQRLAELALGPDAAPMLLTALPTPGTLGPNQFVTPVTRPEGGWILCFTVNTATPAWQGRLPWVLGFLVAALGGALAVLLRRRAEEAEFALTLTQGAHQAQDFNQERLLDFIELSADWLWETDESHRFTLVSSGILNVARLDPQDYLGKHRWDVDYLNTDEAFWTDHRARMDRHEPLHLTLSRPNLDGEVRYLEISGKPLFDGDRFLGYRGVGRDVTERLAADEALRASETRFRDLVELSSDWYWEQDAELRYTALSSNPQNRRPTPFSQLLGRTRWEVAGAGEGDPHWAEHIATLTAHRPFNNFVYESIWFDGQPIWFSVSGRPLFDTAGQFLGYRGVSTDITEERMTQSALAESESRYRTTFENAPVGIATLSTSGLWQSVNDTLCEIFGYQRSALLGQPYSKLTHPNDLAQDHIDLGHLAEGQGTITGREKRFIAQDGSLVWTRVTLSAHHDSQGLTRGLICVVEDITDRMAALQALRASEERYRRLVELAPDGVFVQREGAIQFTNPASLRILGAHSDADLIGRSFIDQVAEEFRDQELAHLHTLTTPGERARIAPHQLRLLRLDGSTIEVESSAVAVELEYQPAVLYMVRDITERLAANRALVESQSRYRDVVESVNEVIFQTDPRGKFLILNQAWSQITGFQVADSLGRSLVDFLHPDDRAKARSTLTKVLSGAQADCHIELRIRTRDGQIRWIEAAVRKAQGANGLSGSLDDISTRKIAELTLKNLNQELEARVRMRTAELENSNRELEAFSYSVSHDLRAPLRAIDGFAHIIEEDYVQHIDPAGRAYLARIRTATHRMAALIDDLIELARLTRQPLRREYIDISDLVAQIVDELRAESPEREVDMQITQGLAANADRALLRVVLENLLRNAWKFTANVPRPQVSVTAERVNNKLTYCVGDNGVGFDMAFANKLFRPFHRLHGSSEFAGSGIGLATVQRIIQRHGGTVWTEAKPGEGARFFFTLG